MLPINRRQLAKVVTAGLATAGISKSFAGMIADAAAGPAESQMSEWEESYPGVWKARLGRPESHTPVSMRLVPPGIDALGKLAAVATPPMHDVRSAITARGCELSFPLGPHERMYGFGLQLLSFEQRSKKRTIRVNADPRVDSGDSHAPVPFYVTTLGYGVLVDTLRHAEFYCGEAHPKPTLAVNAKSVAVNTPQESRDRDQGVASRVLVEVPRAAGVDVYLFGGPSMLEAVQRYNLFAGGGVVPPEWGLGFWYRPDMYLDQEAVLALAREFREREIPCDVLGLEPGWQTHAYSCTFTWEKKRFPMPEKFLKEIASQNYKVNLWEHAFTHPRLRCLRRWNRTPGTMRYGKGWCRILRESRLARSSEITTAKN
jgi:alpha-D-xyloside xylohydrolase